MRFVQNNFVFGRLLLWKMKTVQKSHSEYFNLTSFPNEPRKQKGLLK